jgi:molybdate transport repressor ModE-like protein
MSLHNTQSMFAPDDLQLILAIGEAGSLASAARRLAVDHSSAYRRLGAIEQRAGVRLFERGRGGYAPTAAGEAALAVAARVLDELGALDRQLAGRDLSPSGTVRVTLPETLLAIVVPLVGRFAQAFPGIRIELATANAFFALAKRDADVAIRPAEAPPDGLVARRIAGLASAIYGRSRTLDPATAPWVAPDDTLAHLASARWIRHHVPDARVVLRANSLHALQLAAGEGVGVAALPCFMGDADNRLVRLGEPVAEMASALWLLTHPDLRKAARIRAFLDFAARDLGRRKNAFEGLAA